MAVSYTHLDVYKRQPLKQPGSHSATIRIGEFMNFYKNLEREDVDIMLEVKDKNLSAIKCRNCISLAEDTGALELEWRKYRYAILERSAADYQEIDVYKRQDSGSAIHVAKRYPPATISCSWQVVLL